MPPTLLTNTTVVEQFALRYVGGSSDKVYHGRLTQHGDAGFTVTCENGRYGGTRTVQPKLTAPVPFAEAKRVYDALYNEKAKKGYRPYGTGANALATPLASDADLLPWLNATMQPKDQPAARREQALLDDRWVVQEKQDGWRGLIARQSGRVFALSRTRNQIALEQDTADQLNDLPGGDFVLDAEKVGASLRVFDVCQLDDERLLDFGFMDRHTRWSYAARDTFRAVPAIRTVPVATGTAAKAILVNDVRTNKGEGIIFRLATGRYLPGDDTTGTVIFRHKFQGIAVARVMTPDGRRERSVGFAMLDVTGEWVQAGNVTIPANAPIPTAGELIRVQYLPRPRSHAVGAPLAGALVQTVYLGRTTDHTDADCHTDTLDWSVIAD